MKKCPTCSRTYPDDETFCETDGAALTGAEPAFVQNAGGGSQAHIECPVCGGRAEPGEVICNFCGARLASEDAPAQPSPPPSQTRTPIRSGTTLVEPDASSSDRYSGHLTGQMQESIEEEGSRRSSLSTIGYLLAALVALVGGAWFAIHLSSRPKQEASAPSPVAVPSPPPAASIGPMVALANTISIQVTGMSSSSPERSSDAMRRVFDDGKATLLDAYKRALNGDASISDGMIVRLRVMPDGSVGGAAIRTSTAPNPGLDAEVVKDVSGWSFPPFGGTQVEVDYPVIFSHDPTEQASIESALGSRFANLGPNEAPEYGASLAPSAEPSPAVAAIPAESAAPSPAMPPVAALPHETRPRTPRHVEPKPAATPTLHDRVTTALRSNRSLGRVQFYTNPGGTVVLYGKVFDDRGKNVAEAVARSVPGVNAVVDNLTTDTASWREQQAQVQSQLANAGLDQVNVKIIGKDAFLSGEVKTDSERDRAVTITEGAAPVIVRQNLITVKPGSVFGF